MEAGPGPSQAALSSSLPAGNISKGRNSGKLIRQSLGWGVKYLLGTGRLLLLHTQSALGYMCSKIPTNH